MAGASSARDAASHKVTRDTAGGEATAMVGAAVGPLPLIAIGAAMISQATEIRRNFVSKEMPDQTLSPGSSMDGFIYYQPVPKHTDWTRGASLRIKFTETVTQGNHEMTILL